MTVLENNYWLLDVTVADLLSRHPETEGLFHGQGFALFANLEALASGGILLSVGEALALRGISADLFLLLLEETIGGRLLSYAA